MAGMNVGAVNVAMKTLRSGPTHTSLRVAAISLQEHYQISLRLGSIKLVESKMGLVKEAVDKIGGPRMFSRVLDSVVEWHQTHNSTGPNSFDVQDLIAFTERKINLGRDLHQIGQMKDLVDAAVSMKEQRITVTLGGKDIIELAESTGGRAELLVGLRALIGPKAMSIEDFMLPILDLKGSGIRPLDELLQIIRP